MIDDTGYKLQKKTRISSEIQNVNNALIFDVYFNTLDWFHPSGTLSPKARVCLGVLK